MRDGTEFGRKAKEYMDAGRLLPDDIMVGLVGERLGATDAVDGWILDGFPRTPGQAEALLEICGDDPFDVAIDLDVPESVVIERLSSRRVCSNCGAIYSTQAPPTSPWTCDRCGGDVVQHDDDTEAAIRSRLADYTAQTEPLEWLGCYSLVVVDGNAESEQVTSALVAAIDPRLGPGDGRI